MSELVLTVSRRLSSIDTRTLTPILLLSSAGLFASLLLMTCGFDLSAEFF